MSLVLYYAPMTSSIRAQWALEELEIPYEKRKVDLTTGENRRPDFLALNPNGKVPLLIVHGTPIFESMAILVYLGETYGVTKGLYPAPGLNRAEVLKWMAWNTATLGEAGARYLRHVSDRYPAEERNEKAAATARRDLHDLLGVLDRALDGKEYLVGGRFSFADLIVASFVPFLARFDIPLDGFSHVDAWASRCMARPALARAMQP
ncbi:glutathione S-transferase family protein [Chondromyces crocatus]|uniref:Glutathione S-transferase n=1 Tax=Chondromyces crocatus TaxID=52 RepID=A0A0K1EP59_CHOCO|nr:glutathione S-transferase family protein [Chondromyces crocatus]AKT42594.1 glutathione S-transferase [Chondromyces crocatus]